MKQIQLLLDELNKFGFVTELKNPNYAGRARIKDNWYLSFTYAFSDTEYEVALFHNEEVIDDDQFPWYRHSTLDYAIQLIKRAKHWVSVEELKSS